MSLTLGFHLNKTAAKEENKQNWILDGTLFMHRRQIILIIRLSMEEEWCIEIDRHTSFHLDKWKGDV